MFKAILKTLYFHNENERQLYTAIHLRETNHHLHGGQYRFTIPYGQRRDFGKLWMARWLGWWRFNGKGGTFLYLFIGYDHEKNLVWGDSAILSLLASIWSIRLAIVGSRCLHEVRFRHDLDLEFTDIALVYNTSEGNGHYSALLRRNQEVCSTRPLAYSKKWM